jgi:hypothetical protein
MVKHSDSNAGSSLDEKGWNILILFGFLLVHAHSDRIAQLQESFGDGIEFLKNKW